MKAPMKLVSALVIASCLTSAAFAAANPQIKADATAIDAACTNDASITGCSGEVVGKGLLKCMGSYKKAHKEFRFSEGCRNAMERLREDRKAAR